MLTFFRVLAGTYMFHHVSYLITVIVAKILCGSPKGSTGVAIGGTPNGAQVPYQWPPSIRLHPDHYVLPNC